VRCLELPSHDQTSPESLVDGLNLELRGDHAFGDDVDERSDRRGDAYAVDGLDVSLVEPPMAEKERNKLEVLHLRVVDLIQARSLIEAAL
jgi:hypothetical protein